MSAPTPARPPIRPHEAVRTLSFQVNRDTVLKARAALMAEAERLDTELGERYRSYRGVGLCGGDPVSPDAAAAFNERIDALVLQCFAYNEELRNAAKLLDDTARRYGYTDEEIANSFTAKT